MQRSSAGALAAVALIERHHPDATKANDLSQGVSLVVCLLSILDDTSARKAQKVVGSARVVTLDGLEAALHRGVLAPRKTGQRRRQRASHSASETPAAPPPLETPAFASRFKPVALLEAEQLRSVFAVVRGVHLLDTLKASPTHYQNLSNGEYPEERTSHFPSWLARRPLRSVIDEQQRADSLLQQFFLCARFLTTGRCHVAGVANAAQQVTGFCWSIQHMLWAMQLQLASMPRAAPPGVADRGLEFCNWFTRGADWTHMLRMLLEAFECPETHAVAAALPLTTKYSQDKYLWRLGTLYAFGHPDVILHVKRSADALCVRLRVRPAPLPKARQYALLDDEDGSQLENGTPNSAVDVLYWLVYTIQMACNSRSRSTPMAELLASLEPGVLQPGGGWGGVPIPGPPVSVISLFTAAANDPMQSIVAVEGPGSLGAIIACHVERGGLAAHLASRILEEMAPATIQTSKRKCGTTPRVCRAVWHSTLREWRQGALGATARRANQCQLAAKVCSRVRQLQLRVCELHNTAHAYSIVRFTAACDWLALERALVSTAFGLPVDRAPHWNALIATSRRIANHKRQERSDTSRAVNNSNAMNCPGEFAPEDETGTLSGGELLTIELARKKCFELALKIWA